MDNSSLIKLTNLANNLKAISGEQTHYIMVDGALCKNLFEALQIAKESNIEYGSFVSGTRGESEDGIWFKINGITVKFVKINLPSVDV